MKWVVLSVQYTELYIHGRVLKVTHVLKRVSDPFLMLLFSSLGHERVSVSSRLPSDYTKPEYDALVKQHVRQLKEKLCGS